MSDTLAQQLDSVQAAIRAIEEGSQEITVGSRTYRKADLKTLYDREKALRREISSINGDDRRVCEL
jgi:hypothetical protein